MPSGVPDRSRRPTVPKYFKSRYLEKPTVYVQEEGQWRGYAPGGVLQQSSGPLPGVILARTVEITPGEAEALIAAWQTDAQGVQQQRPAPSTAPGPSAAPSPGTGGEGEGQAATSPAVAGTPLSPELAGYRRVHAVSPRSRWPRWLPYALGGGGAVVVIAVLVVLALTGVIGGGTGLTQAGTTQEGGKTTDKLPADTVAVVGGVPITEEQVGQRMADFQAQYPGQIPDEKSSPDRFKSFQAAVLDYMVTYQLAEKKAEELGIGVTDADVSTQMGVILDLSFGGDQTKFDDALRQQGLTFDQFERSYRESMVFGKVYEEVTKNVEVGDPEIQAYFDLHAADLYAGRSLDEVKEEISGTLLEAKRTATWQQWIDQVKADSGVTYAGGWEPVATGESPLP